MKNKIVKPFRTIAQAHNWIASKGCMTDEILQELDENGYTTLNRFHVVIDPNGDLTDYEKHSILKEWNICFKELAMWFKVWRMKR